VKNWVQEYGYKESLI